tara:strand:+ start:14 stop:259 length:246 start_codon:yes stop_codon:yes gene_type:complete
LQTLPEIIFLEMSDWGDDITCNICDSEIEEDAGDVVGYFGISPVAFCVWCYTSLTDMVIQMQGLDDIDVLQERIDNIKEND